MTLSKRRYRRQKGKAQQMQAANVLRGYEDLKQRFTLLEGEKEKLKRNYYFMKEAAIDEAFKMVFKSERYPEKLIHSIMMHMTDELATEAARHINQQIAANMGILNHVQKIRDMTLHSLMKGFDVKVNPLFFDTAIDVYEINMSLPPLRYSYRLAP